MSEGDETPKRHCPCCGYRTLRSCGHYEICPVCFWEDEPGGLCDPDYRGGANPVSLRTARANFERFGAAEARFRTRVRLFEPSEMPRTIAPFGTDE